MSESEPHPADYAHREPTVEEDLHDALITCHPVELMRAAGRAYGEILSLRAAVRSWGHAYERLLAERFILTDKLRARIRELEEGARDV